MIFDSACCERVIVVVSLGICKSLDIMDLVIFTSDKPRPGGFKGYTPNLQVVFGKLVRVKWGVFGNT